MKTSSTIILAFASLIPVTLGAPVDPVAVRDRSSSLSSTSSEQHIADEIDFANEPNNELIAPSASDFDVLKRRRFVPATVLESRSKQPTTMSDLIDFASEPGQELVPLDAADLSKRNPTSAANEAKVETAATPERRAKSDNDFYDNNWGFGEPSDHISASPDLSSDDGFADPGFSDSGFPQ